MLETAAEHLTLFPVELVAAGVVEIDSLSGSGSSSSSMTLIVLPLSN